MSKGECEFLSEAMLSFCDNPCGSEKRPEMIRKTLLDNVLTSTPRKTNPRQMIADQARLADKLHDGEPEILITAVEDRCPKFFEELPRRDSNKSPIMEQKKQFISNYIRHFYHQGMIKYSKPSFNKNEEIVSIS